MPQPELRPTLSVSTMSNNDEQWSYTGEETVTSQSVLGQCGIKSQHAGGTFKTAYALFIYGSKDWVRSLGHPEQMLPRWATILALAISIIKCCPVLWNPEKPLTCLANSSLPIPCLKCGCMQPVDCFPQGLRMLIAHSQKTLYRVWPRGGVAHLVPSSKLRLILRPGHKNKSKR